MLKYTGNESVRSDAIKMNTLAFFQAEILNQRLEGIQKLYDAAHITNDMLVNKLHEHAPSVVDFNHAVYIDIARVIIDEMQKNPELWDIFDSIYRSQYEDLYSGFEKADRQVEKDYDKASEVVGGIVRRVFPKSLLARQSLDDSPELLLLFKSARYRMMSLLSFRCDNLIKYGIIQESSLVEAATDWNKRESKQSELYHNDDNVVFTDSGEKIFSSVMYMKFLERRKKALAEYLGISVDKLDEYFYDYIQDDLRIEDFSFSSKPGEGGIAHQAAIHIVQLNYGVVQWVHTITASKTIRKGSAGYHPDFNKIADAYYRARVFCLYTEKVNHAESFLRSTLSRECVAETPRDEFIGLSYLYNIDIVYQMFKAMQEENYKSFSWENVIKKNLITRDQMIIREMRDLISDKDRKIIQLEKRLSERENTIRQDIGNTSLVYEKRERALIEQVEEQDEAIENLKKRLQIQEEYIAELKKKEETDETISPNIEVLQTKRYLFVGDTETGLYELHKHFPDSVFMNSETDNISGIRVDAVVLLIKRMSHAMFYKVRASTSLKGLPEVHCNTTTNINSVYTAMMTLF